MNVKDEDNARELDTNLKVHLRNAVTNYVIPDIKFLSHDRTNVVRGNLERRKKSFVFFPFILDA
jgi:hypothetical protein